MTESGGTTGIALTQSELIAQRLALLLTGDEARADAVLGVVLASQADLDAIEIARVRRLVILRSREESLTREPTSRPWFERVRARHLQARGEHREERSDTRPEVFDGIALVALRACERLDRQQMEAWLLHRVEDLDLRQAARAMDCSTSALQRHLERAEESLTRTLGGEYVEAIDSLRAQSRRERVLASLLWTRERLRRARTLRRVVVMGVGVLVAIALIVLVLRIV
ncbi:MAG: sigma factor-like helix-turn-helix DNA-binding protein [Phycisphaerales bacterium JB043]